MLTLLVPGVGMGGGLSGEAPLPVGPMLALSAHLAAAPLTADLERPVIAAGVGVGVHRVDLEG